MKILNFFIFIILISNILTKNLKKIFGGSKKLNEKCKWKVMGSECESGLTCDVYVSKENKTKSYLDKNDQNAGICKKKQGEKCNGDDKKCTHDCYCKGEKCVFLMEFNKV